MTPRRSARTLSLAGLTVAALALGTAATSATAATNATTATSATSPSARDGAAYNKAKVTIKRDAYGVPHIYARTTFDLFRGYGYAVAEDRLFQMEMNRRATQGTVSEVLGSAYLALDKDTRNGFAPASIRAQLAALKSKDRAVLDGYAAGMNEYLKVVRASPGTLMPKQFLDYGFQPSRWTAYDVAMVWIGTMANRYSDSTAEIPNYGVLQSLIAANGPTRGQELFDQLQWIEDPLAPTTAPRTGAFTKPANKALDESRKKLAQLTPGLRDVGVERMKRNGGGDWPNTAPTASNLWAVGKDKAEGAKSILVNGPQFQWFNPSYVYGVGLHGAGFDLVGSTPFAYPAVIFGTNNTIAWGATAGPLNLVDVYQERLNPANPNQYWYKGAWRNFKVRTDTIKVKGEADVTFEVKSTVHGFVTSVDSANNTAYSKKRSWSGYEVQSLLAWTNMPKSKNFAEFDSYAAKFATTINWYYSDKRGNIGYISPGRMPDRRANHDIRIPAVGDGSMEWKGILPPTANPKTYNPAQGFIANWNNQSGPGQNNDYGNWSVVDRVQEIAGALSSQDTFTPEEMWALNEKFSFADLNRRYLAPTLADAAAALPAGDPLREAVELVTTWDGRTADDDGDGDYDGPAPAVMRAWLPLLFQAVLADDLPANVYAAYTAGIYPTAPVENRGSIRPAQATKLVYNAILGNEAGVPQTVDFFDGETPGSVLLETYAAAIASLTGSAGSDPAGWTTPTAYHQFNYKNFLGVPQANPEEQFVGPQYMNRGTANHMAVLGAGQPRLCIVAPPGQSGFIAPDGTKSAHYDDQMDLFANFECRNEELRPRDVRRATESTTVLR